jgi:Tfp pilus assembly protein PilF
VANALLGIASTFSARGLYNEAEERVQRALVIRQKVLGVDHPLVADALNNLGAVQVGQGRDDEARKTLERCLAIRDRKAGQCDREAWSRAHYH